MIKAQKLAAIIAFSAVLVVSVSYAASAQIYNKRKSGGGGSGEVSALAENSARNMAQACIGNWESKACLRASSQSSLEMAATYAEKLDNAGRKEALEILKDQCAASTAATRGDYPAYAMTSAYTECANIIVDITDATGIEPDIDHYQLLVGAVLCLTKDKRCTAIEQGLQKYK